MIYYKQHMPTSRLIDLDKMDKLLKGTTFEIWLMKKLNKLANKTLN